MSLSFSLHTLELAQPFTIARGTQLEAPNVVVQLRADDMEGIGEAAPSEHYGDTRETTLAFLERVTDVITGVEPISTVHARLDQAMRFNPAPKAAIDMAVYDVLGKRAGMPVYELLGLDPNQTPVTSLTIGIDTPEAMAEKARAAKDFPVLKVKVGTPQDRDNLEAVRSVSSARLRIDANAAWTPKEAVAHINELARFGIELVEQPVRADDLAGLGFVREHSLVPIFADESCVGPADVARVAPFVDGINIKLMKCGGIYPALQMIHIARALNLQVMMGCMIESSLSITAAAHLSPLLDFADLDGNLLIKEDPFKGVSVDRGRLVLPTAPGLGVVAV
jgi:L-alanine-DL-glutamate epimerase-like enolase superfamily enzyme